MCSSDLVWSQHWGPCAHMSAAYRFSPSHAASSATTQDASQATKARRPSPAPAPLAEASTSFSQAPPASGPVTPRPPRRGPWPLSFKHQWWGLGSLPPSWAPRCRVLAGQGHKRPSRPLSLTFSSGEGPACGAAGGFPGGPGCALSAALAGPLAGWGLPRQGLWAPRPGRDLGPLPPTPAPPRQV